VPRAEIGITRQIFAPIARSLRPPESLSDVQRRLLLLLALVSLSSAFINTLFTQTVVYAAKEFDITNFQQGLAAAIVRWGIVISIPLVAMADKRGRRKMMIWLACIAPLATSLGALSPNFSFLVATQTIGRPLGLTLDVLIAVVLIEEMPRDKRAYTTGVLAIVSGIGAGIAVATLPFADIAEWSWRLSYITPLIWIPVGVYLKRNLPETKRFSERVGQEVMDKRIDKKRLANVCTVVFLTNIFIASVSIFQNRYLDDVRGYSAFAVALFTAATSVPAVIGLVIGGRVADARGRRILASTMVPLGAMLFTLSFTFDSVAMWASAIGGGIALAFSYPALAVYRGELFPTSRRSLAGGLIMTSALIGGSIGLIATGQLVDGDLSYGQAITIMAIGPLIASILVYVKFPETAGMELEDINVGDRISDARDLDQRL